MYWESTQLRNQQRIKAIDHLMHEHMNVRQDSRVSANCTHGERGLKESTTAL